MEMLSEGAGCSGGGRGALRVESKPQANHPPATEDQHPGAAGTGGDTPCKFCSAVGPCPCSPQDNFGLHPSHASLSWPQKDAPPCLNVPPALGDGRAGKDTLWLFSVQDWTGACALLFNYIFSLLAF